MYLSEMETGSPISFAALVKPSRPTDMFEYLRYVACFISQDHQSPNFKEYTGVHLASIVLITPAEKRVFDVHQPPDASVSRSI